MPSKDDLSSKGSQPIGMKEPAAGEIVRKEVTQ